MEFNLAQFGAPLVASPWSYTWIPVPHIMPILDPGICTYAAVGNESVHEVITIIYPATNHTNADDGDDGAHDDAAVAHKPWLRSVYEWISQLPKVDLVSQLPKVDLTSQLSKIDSIWQSSNADLMSQLSKIDSIWQSSNADLTSQMSKATKTIRSVFDLATKQAVYLVYGTVAPKTIRSVFDLATKQAVYLVYGTVAPKTIRSVFDLATKQAVYLVYGTVAPMTTAAIQRVATTYSHVLSIPIPMLSAAPVAPPPNRFLRVLAMPTPSHPPAIVKVFRYALGTMTPPRFPATTPTWKLILYLLELRVPPQLVPPASFWRIWFLAPQPVADTTMASTIIVVTTVVMAMATCWGLCMMARKLVPSGTRWLLTVTSAMRRGIGDLIRVFARHSIGRKRFWYTDGSTAYSGDDAVDMEYDPVLFL